jgi:hypothetical protein
MAAGLSAPAVHMIGFLSPKEMAVRIAATAHVLFSPVSYLPEERQAMRLQFPSKLVDYTAIGLPVLIWGPEDSSAVRWARDNPGAAAVVTDPSGVGVFEAVTKLATNPGYARQVAAAGLAAGNRDFDLATARARFLALVTAARRPTALPPSAGLPGHCGDFTSLASGPAGRSAE